MTGIPEENKIEVADSVSKSALGDLLDSSSPKHEIPYFDGNEWTVDTRHGMIWKLWPDERNNDPNLYEEAVIVIQKVIETGQPHFGGWR